MKYIIAINGSPRSGWNTDILIREAAAGAESEGADVEMVDLYKLEQFTGCISCFGCKTNAHRGKCIYKDALTPILEKIRNADGLILGTPIYLGEASAGFRALYERLIFQYITYQLESRSYNVRSIPVVLIFTSNVSEERYAEIGYGSMVESYQNTFQNFIGPTKLLISGDTLQIGNYDKYNWTAFNSQAKKMRRESFFSQECKKAYALGANLLKPQIHTT